jgi:hydroxymethylpyrimidine/phosphomethylpyrimidine kinase
MIYERPIVISIAGFDPTGGAGLLADVKTFEQHHCLGMSVVSALTIQTESQVLDVEWLSPEKIIQQLTPLLETYSVRVFKIGIVENLSTLNTVIRWIKQQQPQTFIVWDTVLHASAGTPFLGTWTIEELTKVLSQLDVITPNSNEVCLLANTDDETAAATLLSNHCSVLLKGGHSLENPGIDRLFSSPTKTTAFHPSHSSIFSKHGSGCILASALAANIALGHNLIEACERAKKYTEQRLASNQQLLAYHVE